MRQKILHILILLQLTLPTGLMAVESAPDISDREIVEKLAILATNQNSLEQLINHRIGDLNHRIGDFKPEMKTGQLDLRSEIKAGYDALSKRIEDLSKRMIKLKYTMLALFSVLVVLIAALFGYIAWDRRTMLKPISQKIERLERDVRHDFDLSSPEGSKIDRLINAMRELARTDEKIATALRSFSLL